jgi:hypothetical protein
MVPMPPCKTAGAGMMCRMFGGRYEGPQGPTAPTITGNDATSVAACEGACLAMGSSCAASSYSTSVPHGWPGSGNCGRPPPYGQCVLYQSLELPSQVPKSEGACPNTTFSVKCAHAAGGAAPPSAAACGHFAGPLPLPPVVGHEYHKDLADSEYRSNTLQARFFSSLKNAGMYIHAPENYIYYGQSKGGMTYNENQFSLPRWEELELSRIDMYDSTYWTPVTGGWMFVPIEPYHAGGSTASFAPASQHLPEMEWALATYFGYGVMPCWRGPVLYDNDASHALFTKWVGFYKRYREILTSDIVHVRRPDARGIDAILHVNPSLNVSGLAVVYNPTAAPVNATLRISLYYTGLSDGAVIAREDRKEAAQTVELGRDYTVAFPVVMEPRSVVWWTVTAPPTDRT